MIDLPDRDVNEAQSRLRNAANSISVKLRERGPGLLAAIAICAAFVVFGGLPAQTAAAGAGALLLWATLWPNRADYSGKSEFERNRNWTAAVRAASGPVWMSIVESLPDPALVLDAGGSILAANAAAADLFSNARPGRHISQITRAPELLTSVETALETRESQSCRLDFKVPVERSLVGTVAPLKLTPDGDQSPQLVIVLRDLTEQDRLIRMRADFVANASHELRTPLASLKGFVETLQGAAKDDAAARDKFLKIMHKQAERMARLIDDLLSLSRVEMQAHVMPRDKVDLNTIIAHVVQTLAPIAQEKLVTVDVVPASSASFVTGDRDELIQVFQNLIENAIKYGRQGGRVSVRTTIAPPATGPHRITVAVGDDGSGIAPEHLPRLTERFYRVSAAHSRTVGGTGLGLAIVKHVLNRHRADLQIDSVVGQGSTFRVTFPSGLA
jgi:two-component system, OmpR family, phosphate regulon sensor histidine kinase PhoR